MKLGERIRTPLIMLAAGLFLTLTASTRAQVQSETSTTKGAKTSTTKVVKGTVVYVSGNHLIVKLDSGEIRDFPNVPESARATVDGKEIGIHDVKVGMTLEKTTTVTTRPQMVTTVETVSGKIFNIMPPNSVILTMDDGKNQQFKIPKGQKFNVDGQTVDAFGLRKGMNISATKVVEVPETVQTQHDVISGKLPPPPPPPPDVPVLIAVIVPVPAPAPEAAAPAPEPAPASLPKTGSVLPAIGLAGALMLFLGLGLRARRLTR